MLELGEELVAAAKRQYHKTASASSLVLSRLTSESFSAADVTLLSSVVLY